MLKSAAPSALRPPNRMAPSTNGRDNPLDTRHRGAPELDPNAHVVEADHFLFGVDALSDDAVVRHLKAAVGKFSDGIFGILMAREDGDHGVLVTCWVFHDVFLVCKVDPD